MPRPVNPQVHDSQQLTSLRTEDVSALRQRTDTYGQAIFGGISWLPIAAFVAIAVGLVLRALPLFAQQSFSAVVFGTLWKPAEGSFGLLPFLLGTVWVTALGVGLAAVPSIAVALYLSEYATPRMRAVAKPVLDVLAGLPPVIYGLWGLLTVVPFIQDIVIPAVQKISWLPFFAIRQPTGFTILAAGVVLAVMISPLIISIVLEICGTIPLDLRLATYALGTTRWESIRSVLFPSMLPGVCAAIVFAASRALGETIAVLMVVGNVVQIPQSLFDSAYPLPALLANNYGEMMSIPQYDAALMSAALLLLGVIIVFNLTAAVVIQRFRRRGA